MQTFFQWVEAIVRGEPVSKESQLASKLFRATLNTHSFNDEHLESNPEFAQELESAISQMEIIILNLKKPESFEYLRPRGKFTTNYLRKFINYLARSLGRATADTSTLLKLNSLIDQFRYLLVSGSGARRIA